MEALFETPFWRVDLSPNQAYLGRAIVTARREVGSIPELSAEEWEDLRVVISDYERGLREAFGATMFNWTCLMNDAYKAAVPKPHLHLHVWPRYANSVRLGGETYTDPNFGHHYDKTIERLTDNRTRFFISMEINRVLHAN